MTQFAGGPLGCRINTKRRRKGDGKWIGGKCKPIWRSWYDLELWTRRPSHELCPQPNCPWVKTTTHRLERLAAKHEIQQLRAEFSI